MPGCAQPSRRRRPARWIALLALSLLACERAHPFDVEIDTAGQGADVARYELRVSSGECPTAEAVSLGTASPALVETSFTPDAPMAVGRLAPGSYALAVLGRGVDCVPRLFGCQAFVTGQADTVRVRLDAVSWPGAMPRCAAGRVCREAACVALPGDAGPDADVPCSAPSECGPPELVECSAPRCGWRDVTVDALAPLDPAIGFYGVQVSVDATIEDGAPWVHVGTLPVVGERNQAVVTSFPLPTLDERDTGRPLQLSPATAQVDGLDVRSTGSDLHVAFSGFDTGDERIAHWTAVLATPGELPSTIAIRDPAERVRGLGPTFTAGATSPSIRHVLRTRSEVTGSVGIASLTTDGRPEARVVPTRFAAPSADGVWGSGSRGPWVALETAPSASLVLWRTDGDTSASAPREPGSGPPSLAYLGGDDYALAYRVDDEVLVRRLRCTSGCTVVDGRIERIALTGLEAPVELVELDGGVALIASVIRGDQRALVAVALTPELRAPGPPLELWAHDGGLAVADVEAVAVAAADGVHLVVVASLRTGSGAASQIAMVRARFR